MAAPLQRSGSPALADDASRVLDRGRRPDERPWLPASVDLALGRTSPDNFQAPDRAAEQGIDLALCPVTGKPTALDPELLAEVHVDDLIGALQVEHDPVGPGAAPQDLLEARHLLRGCLGGHVEVDHLVAHPEFVPGVGGPEDLLGNDLRLLRAPLVGARGGARIALAANHDDRVGGPQAAP